MRFHKIACYLFAVLGLLAFSKWSQAAAFEPIHTLIATVTAGSDFLSRGQASYLALYPPFQNYYTTSKTREAVADLGGFLGIERVINDWLCFQLGGSGYGNTRLNRSGDVWQFGLPLFDDLAYHYRIHHSRAMVEGKLLTRAYYPALHPYFSWQLGAAFNQASHYQEVPLLPGAFPMIPPFSRHRQTSFAWAAGLGLDYNLNQQLRLGGGYQFADLGSVSLGPTAAAFTSQTLNFRHLYANQLRFQLTLIV